MGGPYAQVPRLFPCYCTNVVSKHYLFTATLLGEPLLAPRAPEPALAATGWIEQLNIYPAILTADHQPTGIPHALGSKAGTRAFHPDVGFQYSGRRTHLLFSALFDPAEFMNSPRPEHESTGHKCQFQQHQLS